MSLLLSVRDLRVGFGQDPTANEVVKGVSFDLAAGETLAIVGESGSGKSVTAPRSTGLSISAAAASPAARSRSTARTALPSTSPAADEAALQRVRGREIGMIFQEPMTSLNPVHTVGRQIEEAFRLSRGITGRAATLAAKEALDRVRIPDAAQRLNYYPHQLSGGMRQRVMIAMVIAGNPRLLMADEPTTALDVTVQAQIMALLAELRAETQMSMIFITHDIGLVAGIADQIMVMQHGVAVEQGRSTPSSTSPGTTIPRHLLSAVPHFTSGKAVRSDGVRGEAKPPIVKVDNLVVRFPAARGLFARSAGAVHAVDGVDFDLRPGETLAIVGESGSGKSTTARAILGPNPRDARPDHGRGAGHRPVQMVFQDPFASLNPRSQRPGPPRRASPLPPASGSMPGCASAWRFS